MPHALGHVSSVSTAVDKMLCGPFFTGFCLLFFGFFPFRFFYLLISGRRGCHRGRSAVPSSGVPTAASTIVAASGLAGAGPRCRGGRPSLSAVVSTPPASVLNHFLGTISWRWYGTSLLQLMQQQQANPSLSVSLAPPG